jgi:hypothetical protein
VCFSFHADLAAGLALTPIAIATLRAAPSKRYLPIAALPAVFAAHQAIESIVWLGIDGNASPPLTDFATHVYLVIAQVLLPVLVPLAMWLTEPVKSRRWIMALCGAVGIATAARFGWIIFAHDVGAHAARHVIVYRTDFHIGMFSTLGYVIATCASVLVSSKRYLMGFGVLNVIGLSLAAAVRYEAVTSVWCLYAALVSFMVLLYLRRERAGSSRSSGPRPLASATA